MNMNMNMNELNVEILKGDWGFFALLLLLVIACGMGMWREVRWARVCNEAVAAASVDGYRCGVEYGAGRVLERQAEMLSVDFNSVDVPDSVIDEMNSGYEGYVLGRRTESEGFESAHRGEVF